MTNLTSIMIDSSHTPYLETLRAEAATHRALQATRNQHLQALRQAAQTILEITRTWLIGQPEFRQMVR